MTQRHQRGSVIGFVVVGVLLTIAVVGGIYLVKNQLNGNMPSIPGSDQVAVVEDEVDQLTDDESTQDTADQPGTVDEEDQASPNDDNDNDRPTESRDDVVAEDEVASSDESATTDGQDDIPQAGLQTEEDETATDLPQTGVAVEELPQTGLADSLYALVAVGALTGSVVAFRRSGDL